MRATTSLPAGARRRRHRRASGPGRWPHRGPRRPGPTWSEKLGVDLEGDAAALQLEQQRAAERLGEGHGRPSKYSTRSSAPSPPRLRRRRRATAGRAATSPLGPAAAFSTAPGHGRRPRRRRRTPSSDGRVAGAAAWPPARRRSHADGPQPAELVRRRSRGSRWPATTQLVPSPSSTAAAEHQADGVASGRPAGDRPSRQHRAGRRRRRVTAASPPSARTPALGGPPAPPARRVGSWRKVSAKDGRSQPVGSPTTEPARRTAERTPTASSPPPAFAPP